MNAHEFALRLNGSALTVEQLRGIGLQDVAAARIAESSRCRSKPHVSRIGASNEIGVLATEWDINGLEIGIITLFGEPRSTRGLFQIGIVEADPLLINNSTGKVIVEETGEEGHVLWAVAESDVKFLDAIAQAAEFLNKRLLNPAEVSADSDSKLAADQCAALAGGDEYRPFYQMLLGSE